MTFDHRRIEYENPGIDDKYIADGAGLFPGGTLHGTKRVRDPLSVGHRTTSMASSD